jgi:hypothetical protein
MLDTLATSKGDPLGDCFLLLFTGRKRKYNVLKKHVYLFFKKGPRSPPKLKKKHVNIFSAILGELNIFFKRSTFLFNLKSLHRMF